MFLQHRGYLSVLPQALSLFRQQAFPFLKKKVLALEDATPSTITDGSIVPVPDPAPVPAPVPAKEDSAPISETALVPISVAVKPNHRVQSWCGSRRYLQIFTSICTSFAPQQ
jgi:hypothetical protein